MKNSKAFLLTSLIGLISCATYLSAYQSYQLLQRPSAKKEAIVLLGLPTSILDIGTDHEAMVRELNETFVGLGVQTRGALRPIYCVSRRPSLGMSSCMKVFKALEDIVKYTGDDRKFVSRIHQVDQEEWNVFCDELEERLKDEDLKPQELKKKRTVEQTNHLLEDFIKVILAPPVDTDLTLVMVDINMAVSLSKLLVKTGYEVVYKSSELVEDPVSHKLDMEKEGVTLQGKYDELVAFYNYILRNESTPKLLDALVENSVTRHRSPNNMGTEEDEEEDDEALEVVLENNTPDGLFDQNPALDVRVASCKTCGKLGMRRDDMQACPKCNRFYYCSRDCRFSHWQGGHKKICKRLAQNAK